MTDKNHNYTCPAEQQSCEVIEALSDLQQQIIRLEKQVQTDALTGLVNFRGFEELLAQEMERTRRIEQPTSLIMIDIDHFKQVNDRYGHEIGNQALVHIAELLARPLRKLDTPCRFGGEEFALILPSTDLTAAVLVAERIRGAIEKSFFKIGDRKVQLTISLGVDCYTSQDNQSATELVKNTDSYLYQAKRTGRNCTCHPPIDLTKEKSAVEHQERQELFAVFDRKKN